MDAQQTEEKRQHMLEVHERTMEVLKDVEFTGGVPHAELTDEQREALYERNTNELGPPGTAPQLIAWLEGEELE